MFHGEWVPRVERTPQEIEALINETEELIRASLPQMREDRKTPKKVRERDIEIRKRASHLVHYCLDKPVSENG